MSDLQTLAKEAVPQSDEDYGSERQNKALGVFFDEVEKILPPDDFSDLEAWCLKATTEEMVEEAMRRVRRVG